MSHPSTCKGTMNMKNEKCDYVLLLEYWNVYISSNASGYCDFWGSGHMEASVCIYVATPCWCLFVTCKPRRTKGHPEHDLRIHHLPQVWLRRNFFLKIGNIFLHYLVALSSCNTRFEGEKWELSQLEYSGEIQLLQKDFDMEKTYVDALWTNKTYIEYRKTYQSSMLIQDVLFLRIFNHKTYLSYI